MSVIMTMTMPGDPQELERFAAQNKEAVRAIAAQAKEHGVIAHRFYGSDDGQIMVVDEWPDAESFQRFFAANSDQIGPLMADVGVTGEPEVTFWRLLDTRDAVGWDA